MMNEPTAAQGSDAITSSPPAAPASPQTTDNGSGGVGTTPAEVQPSEIDINGQYTLPGTAKDQDPRSLTGQEIIQEINRGFGYRQLQSQSTEREKQVSELTSQVTQLQDQLAEQSRQTLKEKLLGPQQQPAPVPSAQPQAATVPDGSVDAETDYPFIQQQHALQQAQSPQSSGAGQMNPDAMSQFVDTALGDGALTQNQVRALMQEEFAKLTQAQAHQQQAATQLEREMQNQAQQLKEQYSLTDQQTHGLTTQIEAAMQNMLMVNQGVDPAQNYVTAFQTLAGQILPQMIQHANAAEQTRKATEREAAMLESFTSPPASTGDDTDYSTMTYKEVQEHLRKKGEDRFNQVQGIGP